jgi:hypothetical protein
MQMINLITKINQITLSTVPQRTPKARRSLMIDVQTTGGQEDLEISEEAAVSLRDKLAEHFHARGMH